MPDDTNEETYDEYDPTPLTQAEIDEMAEQERLRALEGAKEEVSGRDLSEVYGPGTEGAHELIARAELLETSWLTYVRTHPACVMDRELFERANRAWEFMHELAAEAADRLRRPPLSSPPPPPPSPPSGPSGPPG